MPDDLFETLARADLGVHPPPAADVRRRGDRLRRRRAGLVAGGTALAVALVVTPLALIDRGRDAAPSPLAPATSSSDQAGPDVVPADFPLADGLAKSTAGATAGTVRIRLCGQGGWPPGATARTAVSSSAEETTDSRELRIYPTEARAAKVVSTLRDVLGTCRSESGGEPQTVTAFDETVGDAAVTWLRTDTSGRPVGEIVQVVQVGRAVLATDEMAEFDLTSGPAAVPDRTALAARIVPAMCRWTADGC